MTRLPRIALFLLAIGLQGSVLPFGTGSQAATQSPLAEPGICQHFPGAPSNTRRVAIIVGNGAYGGGIPALPNPANDAVAVAKGLSDLGFEAFLITDAGRSALTDCLAKAMEGMTGAAIGLIYYSGHGIQINDENFLVATDARVTDLQSGLVSIQPVVTDAQKRAVATLVFLDACRNNPMAGNGQQGLSVSTGRGLARVDAPAPNAGPQKPQVHGLLVAYATSPNAVALDGTGEHSPFTSAFIKVIGTPGYSIQHVMSDVTKSVGEETQWEQTPWTKSSLTEELKLNGGLTSEEARSLSQNWAKRAAEFLEKGDKTNAMAAAIKGLPINPSRDDLTLFHDAYLALYEAERAKFARLPLETAIQSAAFSRGDEVATIRNVDGSNGALELWSISRQEKIAALADTNLFAKMAFAPNGTTLLLYDNGTVVGWASQTGAKLFQTKLARSNVVLGAAANLEGWRPTFSADGRYFAIPDGGLNPIKILDSSTGRLYATVSQKALAKASGTSMSPFTTYSVTFGSSNELCMTIYDQQANRGVLGVFHLAEAKFEPVASLSNQRVTNIFCDSGGRSIGIPAPFTVWNRASKKKIIESSQFGSYPAYDADGKYLSVNIGGTAAVYDVETGEQVQLSKVPAGLPLHEPAVYSTSTNAFIGTDYDSAWWIDWAETPDGPELVAKTLASLPPELRAEVGRDHIDFASYQRSEPGR